MFGVFQTTCWGPRRRTRRWRRRWRRPSRISRTCNPTSATTSRLKLLSIKPLKLPSKPQWQQLCPSLERQVPNWEKRRATKWEKRWYEGWEKSLEERLAWRQKKLSRAKAAVQSGSCLRKRGWRESCQRVSTGVRLGCNRGTHQGGGGQSCRGGWRFGRRQQVRPNNC